MTNTSELASLDYEIWDALSGTRIAQVRVDRIVARLQERQRNVEILLRDLKKAQTLADDLAIHLRDRDRHIKNLEAQLLPYLRHEVPVVQGSLIEEVSAKG